jgi:hypothetical protein
VTNLARVAGLCCLLAVAASGCSSSPQAPAATAPSSATDAASNGPTREEIAVATRLAQREADTQEGTITAATVTVGPGKGAPTARGCTAGRRVLHITLMGDFPHIVTTGYAFDPDAPGSPPDFTVHSVGIVANPASGRTCIVGVSTGTPHPESGATVLSLH